MKKATTKFYFKIKFRPLTCLRITDGNVVQNKNKYHLGIRWDIFMRQGGIWSIKKYENGKHVNFFIFFMIR